MPTHTYRDIYIYKGRKPSAALPSLPSIVYTLQIYSIIFSFIASKNSPKYNKFPYARKKKLNKKKKNMTIIQEAKF